MDQSYLGLRLWESFSSDWTAQDLCSFLASAPETHALEQSLGHQFTQKETFYYALSHRSLVNELPFDWCSYERLEFLGDAVLDSIISYELHQSFPASSEGELSRLRGALVNKESLAELSHNLQLSSCMLLGKGEAKTPEFERENLLGDGVESLLGALFLDAGYTKVQELTLQFFKHHYPTWNKEELLGSFEYKSKLQEQTMKLYQEIPEYLCEPLVGGAFKITLRIRQQPLKVLQGLSKKKTERALAKWALKEKAYLC